VVRQPSTRVLKLGISDARQDTPVGRLWRRGLIASTVLHEESSGADDPTRFERVVRQICLANGVIRTTWSGRFLALNDEVQRVIREHFPPGTALVVEDCAVSSGITAAEWYRRLRADYPDVRFTASDRMLFLVEVRTVGRPGAFVMQADGVPIQFILPPFVVSLIQSHHWIYVANRAVRALGRRLWARRHAGRVTVPEGWDDVGTPAAEQRAGGVSLRRIPLVHPDALAMRGSRFRLREHSVLQALPEPVDVLRTMNILNRSYFGEAELRTAIAAAGRSVREGGIWIVGRTVDERLPLHDVSLLQRRGKGWRLLTRVGAGSEIENLVPLDRED
jgi:hypothetical protein